MGKKKDFLHETYEEFEQTHTCVHIGEDGAQVSDKDFSYTNLPESAQEYIRELTVALNNE